MRAGWLAAGLAFLASSLLLSAYLFWSRNAPDMRANEVRESFVWKAVSDSHRPLTIVLGDLFLFSEAAPTATPPRTTRWIRDPEVNSHEDLRRLLARHPELSPGTGATETTFLPKSAAYGLAAILPLVDHRDRAIKLVLADDFDVNDLRDADVIFIGPLSRLGPIGDMYWGASQFRYEREHLRLEDKHGSGIYVSSGSLGAQRSDYGLFAMVPGPAGNHIVILGSVSSDIGLQQVARSLTSMPSIRELDKKLQAIGPAETVAFEALFAATGFARTDIHADIVVVHRLKTQPDVKPSSPP